MKRISTLFSLLMCLVLTQQVRAADAHVNVADFTFSPSTVTINAGESVTWHWVNGIHTIHSDSSPQAWAEATSSAASPTFAHTFTTPGTYPYHCTIHGSVMSGSITVLAGPSGMKENNSKNRLLDVYPNPANAVLKIAITNPSSDNYELRITNAIGKLVKTLSKEELKQRMGTGLTLEVAELPAGLYFVTLWNKEGIVETRRQVIVH